MATATISNYASEHFPCHSIYTEASMGTLNQAMGYDTTWKNHYAQGVPIRIPSDAASNVTSITVSVTFYGYQDLNYGIRPYYVCCIGERYDTAQTGTHDQYNKIKGYTGQAYFESDYTGSSVTKTVTITGLSLAPGGTYYVYVHNGGYTGFGSLHICTNMVVTCTYEEGGRVKIYTSNGWVSAIPWVYTSSGWVKAKPWVYTSSGWQRAK